jgi:DNA polymerase-3 subunit epsilon
MQYLNKNFTIVDVETTGGSPLLSRIIELGIIRVERGEVVQKFNKLINPKTEIPEIITEITGINKQMVKYSPLFEEIAEDILPLFEDSIFVAHNSNFDYKFLKEEFKRAGLMFNMDSLCTVRLSRVLYPQYKKHNLSAIIERFDFECQNRHRAFDDAKVLWDFLQHAEKNFEATFLEKTLDRTIKKLSRTPTGSVGAKKQKKLEKILEPELVYVEEF